jgi:hypothetical protein
LCTYYLLINNVNNDHNTSEEQVETPLVETITDGADVPGNPGMSKNKYYIVYLEQDMVNGYPVSSFVPEKLNPGYDPYKDGFNVSLSFNDDGTMVNDGKIIVISNYKISKSNKEQIKKITGEKNYDGALKEIQETIDNTKGTFNSN